MIDVTRKVMGRRKLALSPAQEAMLREVFTMTRGDRASMGEGARQIATDESALAGAEIQAIRAFDPLEMGG